MTAQIQQTRTLWSTMPGWGIVIDLMPPEIVQQRRIAAVRRQIVIGLAVLLVLILLGFGFAFMKKRSASNDLSRAQDQTTQLQAELHTYADVISIQGTVKSIQSQVANLMKTDVDLPQLVKDVTGALPPGMAITQMTITVNQTASAQGGGTGSNLDTSGHQHIGVVTLTGTGRNLTDLSSYIDQLTKVKGVLQPYPTQNAASSNGTQWGLQLTLDEERYSHRFDVTPPGAK